MESMTNSKDKKQDKYKWITLYLYEDAKEKGEALQTRIAHLGIMSKYLLEIDEQFSLARTNESSKDKESFESLSREFESMFETISTKLKKLEKRLKKLENGNGTEDDFTLTNLFLKEIWEFNLLLKKYSEFIGKAQTFFKNQNDSKVISMISSVFPKFNPKVLLRNNTIFCDELLQKHIKPILKNIFESIQKKGEEDQKGNKSDHDKNSEKYTEPISLSELGGELKFMMDTELIDTLLHTNYKPEATLISSPFWNIEFPRYLPLFIHEMAHIGFLSGIVKKWKENYFSSLGKNVIEKFLDDLYYEIHEAMQQISKYETINTTSETILEEILVDIISFILMGPTYLNALFLEAITSVRIEAQIKFSDIKIGNPGGVMILRVMTLLEYFRIYLEKYKKKINKENKENKENIDYIKFLEEYLHDIEEFLVNIAKNVLNDVNKSVYNTFVFLAELARNLTTKIFFNLETNEYFADKLKEYSLLNYMVEYIPKKYNMKKLIISLNALDNFNLIEANHQKVIEEIINFIKFIFEDTQHKEDTTPNRRYKKSKENIIEENWEGIALNLIWLKNIINFKEKEDKNGETSEKEKCHFKEGQLLRFFQDLFYVLKEKNKEEEKKEKKKKNKNILNLYLRHYHLRKPVELLFFNLTDIRKTKWLQTFVKNISKEDKTIYSWSLMGEYDYLIFRDKYKGRSKDNLTVKAYEHFYKKNKEKDSSIQESNNNIAFQVYPVIADKICISKEDNQNKNDNNNNSVIISRILFKSDSQIFELLEALINKKDWKTIKPKYILRSTSWDSFIIVWGIKNTKPDLTPLYTKSDLTNLFKTLLNIPEINNNNSDFKVMHNLLKESVYSNTYIGFNRESSTGDSSTENILWDLKSSVLIEQNGENLTLRTIVSYIGNPQMVEALERKLKEKEMKYKTKYPSGTNMMEIYIHGISNLDEIKTILEIFTTP